MPVPQTFADARAALKTAREATASALYARTTAQQDLDAASRLFDPQSIEFIDAQKAFDIASATLTTARATEAGARTTLNDLIVDWVTITESNPPAPIAPDDDLARLDL